MEALTHSDVLQTALGNPEFDRVLRKLNHSCFDQLLPSGFDNVAGYPLNTAGYHEANTIQWVPSKPNRTLFDLI